MAQVDKEHYSNKKRKVEKGSDKKLVYVVVKMQVNDDDKDKFSSSVIGVFEKPEDASNAKTREMAEFVFKSIDGDGSCVHKREILEKDQIHFGFDSFSKEAIYVDKSWFYEQPRDYSKRWFNVLNAFLYLL